MSRCLVALIVTLTACGPEAAPPVVGQYTLTSFESADYDDVVTWSGDLVVQDGIGVVMELQASYESGMTLTVNLGGAGEVRDEAVGRRFEADLFGYWLYSGEDGGYLPKNASVDCSIPDDQDPPSTLECEVDAELWVTGEWFPISIDMAFEVD